MAGKGNIDGQDLQMQAFAWADRAHQFLNRRREEEPGLTSICDELEKKIEEAVDLAISDHATGRGPVEAGRRFVAVMAALREIRVQQ